MSQLSKSQKRAYLSEIKKSLTAQNIEFNDSDITLMNDGVDTNQYMHLTPFLTKSDPAKVLTAPLDFNLEEERTKWLNEVMTNPPTDFRTEQYQGKKNQRSLKR